MSRRQAWNAGQRRHLDLSNLKAPSGTATAPAAAGSSTIAANQISEEESDQLIHEALAARGTRYRWGGASRGGFDCSGFTRYLFARHIGVKLPHSASAQSKLGQKVTRETLEPGDLLFFRTYRRGISHVGLYVGDNKFVHAASTRHRVRVDTIDEPYYQNRFVTARRIRDPARPASRLPQPVKPPQTAAKLPLPAAPPRTAAKPPQPAKPTRTEDSSDWAD